jgi:hypothetical protein
MQHVENVREGYRSGRKVEVTSFGSRREHTTAANPNALMLSMCSPLVACASTSSHLSFACASVRY